MEDSLTAAAPPQVMSESATGLKRVVGVLKDLPIGLLDTVIHFGLRPLPIDWCSHVGIYLGLFARLRYPESDKRARIAWQTLRPEAADPAATEAALVRLWRDVGRTMAEYSVLWRLLPSGRVKVEGTENVPAPGGQRPVLFMAMHLGNWEVIPPTVIAQGFTQAKGIYLPPDNRFDHWIAIAARRDYASKLVIPGPNATRVALKALRDGSGFVIFADEFVRGRVHAPAFGRPHATAGSNIAYVARLAAMTGAIVVPVYCVREGDAARFTVRFLPPVALQTTNDRREDVAENVKRLDAVMDPLIRAHLDQWFYVLDFDFAK